MTQSRGWKQHLLLHPGLSFLRAEAFQGMLHNQSQHTLTPAPPQSRAGMLPENQCSLGSMDPSQGCSSHILSPFPSLFQPPGQVFRSGDGPGFPRAGGC